MSSTVATLITLFVVGLVPLAPTEPVLIGMGVFAASGQLPLLAVIITAAVACTLSDHLLYLVGRLGGAWALRRVVTRPSIKAAHDWLTTRVVRWGAPVLIVGRWLPAGGTIGALLTGTLSWRLRRFTPASVIGATLWSTYVALIGYFGGALAGRQPVYGLLISLGVAAVLGVTCSLVVQRTHRRKLARAGADTGGTASLVPGQSPG